MDIHAILILHLRNGELQRRQIMIGTALAEEMDIMQEVPDVIAIPQEGFFKYDVTDDNGEHHYLPVWGYALSYRN